MSGIELIALAVVAGVLALGALAYAHWPASMAWPLIALSFVAIYICLGIACGFYALGKLYGLFVRRA